MSLRERKGRICSQNSRMLFHLWSNGGYRKSCEFERNKAVLATEVVQHFFHAWNRHDLHDIQDYFADNGTYKDPGSEVPLTGEAIFRACESFFAAFSDLSLEITDLIYA